MEKIYCPFPQCVFNFVNDERLLHQTDVRYMQSNKEYPKMKGGWKQSNK